MAYRVEYRPIKKLRRVEQLRWRRLALTAMCFALFLILVHTCWPLGENVLCSMLFSGDREVTAMALETFAQELSQGEALGNAFKHFCMRILEGAKLAAP